MSERCVNVGKEVTKVFKKIKTIDPKFFCTYSVTGYLGSCSHTYVYVSTCKYMYMYII